MPQFAALMETFHTAQAGAGRGAGAESQHCELYISELGRAMPRLRLVLAK